jgi:hypothetical protein
LGKRTIITDPREYNGADIVALFREGGAEVFAESWDMTKPEMADEIVRAVTGAVFSVIPPVRTARKWR